MLITLATSSPGDVTQKIVREIRSNEELINLLRGPKGEEGLRGKPGKNGSSPTIDEVLAQLEGDARFRNVIERLINEMQKKAVANP